MRVVCVAAHPDDEILGVGGTLLRHKAEGDLVQVLIAKQCRPESTRESFDAASRMSIDYTRHDDIESFIADWVPDVVYTHWRGDLNADHRWVHERVLVACRPQSDVKAIYAFDTPSSTEWGIEPFIPNRFVDVGDYIEDKCFAMEAYASELRDHPHPRNIDGLYDRAAHWGDISGFDYAEAFAVIRERV